MITRRSFSQAGAILLAGCGGGDQENTTEEAAWVRARLRTWSMGFGTYPPQWTVESIVENLNRAKLRSEVFSINAEPPWAEILSGVPAATIIARDTLPLVQLYKAAGLSLILSSTSTNGYAREAESAVLVGLGRSITEPAVRQAYSDYFVAAQNLLDPIAIFVEAETNLIRAAASSTIYNAVVTCATKAATDLRSAGYTGPLGVGVQAETAWGWGTTNSFVGIAADLRDFAFANAIGVSSYPYFYWKTPSRIPLDCFSRLFLGTGLPVYGLEGGWNSKTVGTTVSSETMQANYIPVYGALLDSVSAKSGMLLYYADLVAGLPPSFANLGLTHSDWSPKPALAKWDALHARNRA
jgi:hypothetical protein